ncbi:MAG: fumarylacetoacetate hydrolase family protein [Cypionkella sp.]|uniref:fumarylacetoacetate hydrolase family protein n=1 Tax=Cypionkella sp. TaxID=2811411 RepID=UPI002ABB2D20|nr:fumarylacetoacetate hydrolase family protein [Cypionkella sp.]MDZ4311990.1 fumarylacetoacetate hydrolase family protein [Cypionkella sp.]MDZ4394514.1 fumarylacetoacetate hydrolase family protein [Cypionkella sp.]
MGFVLKPAALPSVAVENSTDRFAVRRIFCVGRNYAEHAREMGHDPDAEPPFFFNKPADAVIDSGHTIPYPAATIELHHEAELVVALGAGGAFVSTDKAKALIWGYAAGNDLTRRDLQAEAKAARRPWDMAKGFDNSAVVGPLRPAVLGKPSGRIRCLVDGKLTQDADLGEMIWSVAGIIGHLSRLVTLQPGDLIFTGTPAGIGPIARGQLCEVQIDGLQPASVRLV